MREPEEIERMTPGVDPKSMGLFPKYDVIKRETGELMTKPVFVLSPETDPLAMLALQFYAVLAHIEGYEPLSDDLSAWLMKLKFGSEPTLEGVEEWADADLTRQLQLAKQRIAQLKS